MDPTPDTPPPLASIVVACRSGLVPLRRCVATLARCTRMPFELIAVDNGSLDTRAAYLAGVSDVARFPVRILTHPEPVGPDIAIARGLSAARGVYVALLHDDVAVTDGWLDQLIALAESGPSVGLAGPMSNLARPPQRVEGVPYGDLDGLVRFAAAWRAEHLGRWREVDDLGGPCLLLTRRALEAIGGSTGGGLIDRARAAGFRPAVACDLFVHRGPMPLARIARIEQDEFAHRFGAPDTSRALLGYTLGVDAHSVLALVAHVRPLRILEVGTALGHMTANLTEWSPDKANVFSLGIVRGMDPGGAAEQKVEAPAEADFGRHAGHFGKADKVTFVRADSRAFDFASLAPLDFAFIDGGHDLELATNDTRRGLRRAGAGGLAGVARLRQPAPVDPRPRGDRIPRTAGDGASRRGDGGRFPPQGRPGAGSAVTLRDIERPDSADLGGGTGVAGTRWG